MRTVAGLFLAAFILLLPLSVLGQDANQTQGPNLQPQYMQPRILISPDQPKARTFTLTPKPFLMQEFRSFGGQDVCYTMRVLVVAREKGSDRTRLVGQRTCTPASQFRMNHSAPPGR